MPPNATTRRRYLTLSTAVGVALAGCSSERSGSDTSPPPSPEPVSSTARADGTLGVDSQSVADYVRYPLGGTHPHVHRRANTQYVILRTNTGVSDETVRNRLTLELGSEAVPLAERQPVPWEHETVDLAFAVSKHDTFDAGRVLFDQTVLRSLSDATLERLNNPPVFEVSDPSVAPTEVRTGRRTRATVQFDLVNTGEGRGEFGASLSGNFSSGSEFVTATLAPGEERELTDSVTITGRGETATVRLDWGADEWVTNIPVVGTVTGAESTTATPAPH